MSSVVLRSECRCEVEAEEAGAGQGCITAGSECCGFELASMFLYLDPLNVEQHSAGSTNLLKISVCLHLIGRSA